MDQVTGGQRHRLVGGEQAPAGVSRSHPAGPVVATWRRVSSRWCVRRVEGTDMPVLHDWRLRECDYGDGNGMPAAELYRSRAQRIDQPYPGGESWRQAVDRVGRFLVDLPLRWSDTRILVTGHVATRWAFDHLIDGKPVEVLVEADFGWREGWEYRLG
ncbi:histidine phosphatase family protein [Streptomyces sp. CA-250714]|uniref:histidine phosphatase family protein n=1 Tax=Streptomyces sp. CA-250714 TaxID=3240060 RepID=UPI003D907499